MEQMRERVIVALDAPGRDQALSLVEAIGDHGVFYKVGLELYIAAMMCAARAGADVAASNYQPFVKGVCNV